MSLDTSYRNWEIVPTWSGSLGVLAGGGTHARYRLSGRGVVVPARAPGWRAQPLTMGGHVPRQSVHPGYVPERPPEPDPDPAHFSLAFTGGGLAHGLDLGVTVSSPDHYSEVLAFWTSGVHNTARRFEGNGAVLDISGALIGGCGGQLLLFPSFGRGALSPMGIIGSAIQVADLIDAIRDHRIRTLRDVFPTAALIVGMNWGLAFGATIYEGFWTISEIV